MEEQKVDVEVVPVDVEVDLTADEDPAGQGVLEVAFGDFTGQAE